MRTIYTGREKKVRCRLCNSTLSVPDEDVFTDYYDLDGNPCVGRYFYCPYCGAKNEMGE